ncbi:DNA-binding protein [Hymenobacter antarcticus]|uniref:Helix-turn-helix domain-containing protein n=1 Tax=Hymenobacter antarcticus TaxID=486270 RepID=A0ABP7PLE5_9BACT
MQPAVILSAADWQEITARLARLEAAEQARVLATTTKPDEVLSTKAAAEYIGLCAEALLRARRSGRIAGVRLNEKDWGFRRSVLDAYPRRYHRAAA